MVTTSDEKIATRIRQLRQHAMTTSDLARHSAQSVVVESYDEVGYNFRMTDMQGAIGSVQLRRVEGFLVRRRALALRYRGGLSQLEWLIPPHVPTGHIHNFQSYMVRLRADAPVSRDALMQALLDRGISTRRGIMASHLEAPYRNAEWDRLLPQTNLITKESIILPLFHEMSEDEQEYVIEAIRQIGARVDR